MMGVRVDCGIFMMACTLYSQQELKAHEKRSTDKLEELKKRENHLQWKLEELK